MQAAAISYQEVSEALDEALELTVSATRSIPPPRRTSGGCSTRPCSSSWSSSIGGSHEARSSRSTPNLSVSGEAGVRGVPGQTGTQWTKRIQTQRAPFRGLVVQY